jgi:hypothetical protein
VDPSPDGSGMPAVEIHATSAGFHCRSVMEHVVAFCWWMHGILPGGQVEIRQQHVTASHKSCRSNRSSRNANMCANAEEACIVRSKHGMALVTAAAAQA